MRLFLFANRIHKLSDKDEFYEYSDDEDASDDDANYYADADTMPSKKDTDFPPPLSSYVVFNSSSDRVQQRERYLAMSKRQ